jgi:ABC-type spermidine/putrescine transport system permease subunit II
MFDIIVNEIDPTIAAVSVVQIVLVTVVLVIVSRLGSGAAPAK